MRCGVQFHPERSGATGLRILANFVDTIRFGVTGGQWPRLVTPKRGCDAADRVIPCLDVAGGRVVKESTSWTWWTRATRSSWRPATPPRADEICYLDIGAAPEERATLLDLVRRTAREVFVPLTVGGGVRSPDDMRAVLRAGADKVAVNTAAVSDPG